jgi:hypothetical protein
MTTLKSFELLNLDIDYNDQEKNDQYWFNMNPIVAFDTLSLSESLGYANHVIPTPIQAPNLTNLSISIHHYFSPEYSKQICAHSLLHLTNSSLSIFKNWDDSFDILISMLPATLLTLNGFDNLSHNSPNIEIILERCPNLIEFDLSDPIREEYECDELNEFLSTNVHEFQLLKFQYNNYINLLIPSICFFSSTLISLDICNTPIDDEHFYLLCCSLVHLCTFEFCNESPLTISNIVCSLKLLKNTLQNFHTYVYSDGTTANQYSNESIIELLSTCTHINHLILFKYLNIDSILNFLFQHQLVLPLTHFEIDGEISMEQVSLILSTFTSLQYFSFQCKEISNKPLFYADEQSITQLKYALLNNQIIQ